MTADECRDRRTWWFAVGAVAALGLFIVGFELNDYRTLTKHEGFIAVVSREMLQTGDWIVPQFGELPRLKKPPLGYWSAASVSWAVGHHAPWTARLPFAMAGLALAGLIGTWGAKWYGRWCGLSAALVLLTSVFFVSFSRKAEVDMLLCLLTTSALFLVANSSQDESLRSKAFRWIGIYGLLGLAWLSKFHYGPAMVLGVIAVWHVVDRRRPGLWDIFNPLGLCLLTAAVVIWPWLLLQRVPEAWNIWHTETIGRALGELGREPFWFYIPEVVLQTLPWSLFLWKAGKDSYQKAWKEGNRRERFLWVWFVTQFGILSVSAFKHHHYLMAALPALCLILGRTVAVVVSDLRQGTIRLARSHLYCLAGFTATGGIAAAAGVSMRWPHLTNPAIGLGLGIALSGLLICHFMSKEQWTAGLASLGLGFAISYAILTAMIFPHRDSRSPIVAFAESVRDVLPRNQTLIVYGLKEDPLVYYLEGPIRRVESAADLSRQLEHGESVVLVTHPASIPSFDKAGYTVHTLPLPQDQAGDSVPLVLVKVSPPALASSATRR